MPDVPDMPVQENTLTCRDTVAIVMPALNEEAAVGNHVRALREHPALRALPIQRIIVVDNGSDDATASVARAAGAEVVSEPRRGYGYACLAGVRAAADAGVILLMDADGSDDPDGAAHVAELVLSGAADLAMGSRTRGLCEPGALTPQQRAGNAVGALLLHQLYGLCVSDIGPVRAIHRDALLRLDMREMAFGWSAEMLAKAARAGLRVREAPVAYRRRAGGKSKVAGTLRGTLRASHHILRTLLRYRAGRPSAIPVPRTTTTTTTANALFIVARVPVPGQTKTRLGKHIGHDAAAALYAAFLRDLGTRFTAAARRDGYDLWWYVAAPDGTNMEAFAAYVPPGGALLAQQGAGLGERLCHGFQSLAARGYERIVVLGSDSPHVPATAIADAFAALETHDVVLGPARDGGYYLLGQRIPPSLPAAGPASASEQAPPPSSSEQAAFRAEPTLRREPTGGTVRQEPRASADLFTGIPMSTPHVCEQTLARAHALGLHVALAPVSSDVDEPADLTELCTTLRAAPSRDADSAPETLALLEAMGQSEKIAATLGVREGVTHAGA